MKAEPPLIFELVMSKTNMWDKGKSENYVEKFCPLEHIHFHMFRYTKSVSMKLCHTQEPAEEPATDQFTSWLVIMSAPVGG